MAKIPFEKHRQDILTFKSQEEVYQQYAVTLKTILERAKNLYAPLGFVEARSKKIESFSEKIIRKDKYENPLSDMTDLCGARIIVHFSKQVHELCHFIEQNLK
jgi:ppGpp synthetase/RelA/SpoT-type nucleotidyltranferase